MSRSTLSIAVFAVSVAALFVLIGTKSIWGTGPVTIGLQIAAVLFMLWARLTFGMRSFHASADVTEGKLVTSGPYALVRNPIYASILVFVGASVAAHPSITSVACGVVIFVGMLTRMLLEEREIAAHFGAEYDAYRKRVKRLVPLLY